MMSPQLRVSPDIVNLASALPCTTEPVMNPSYHRSNSVLIENVIVSAYLIIRTMQVEKAKVQLGRGTHIDLPQFTLLAKRILRFSRAQHSMAEITDMFNKFDKVRLQ